MSTAAIEWMLGTTGALLCITLCKGCGEERRLKEGKESGVRLGFQSLTWHTKHKVQYETAISRYILFVKHYWKTRKYFCRWPCKRKPVLYYEWNGISTGMKLLDAGDIWSDTETSWHSASGISLRRLWRLVYSWGQTHHRMYLLVS